MDEQEWIQFGLDNGFVDWFCCRHETLFSKAEDKALDNNEDICVNAFRLKTELTNPVPNTAGH